MNPHQDRLELLFRKYFEKTATTEERKELASLIEQTGEPEVQAILREMWERYEGEGVVVAPENGEEMLRRIFEKRPQEGKLFATGREGVKRQGRVLPGMRVAPGLGGWSGRQWRPMAAAAVLVFLVFSFWFFVVRDKGGDTPVAVTPTVQDVAAPTEARATITLADGRKVALDRLANLIEGGAVVTRDADGAVRYKLQAASATEIVYNTLYNPRGSKVVSLTLSDGTKVWLNAESSLRYPVAFAGSERHVEITGEAYFEVSKANKRFIVEANGLTTEVLGTHFNVNSYADEGATKVTLLEGSVRVGNQFDSVQLVPGQSAFAPAFDKSTAGKKAKADEASQRGSISVIKHVDTEAVMAWKEGMFEFKSAGIEAVMRELARWYDVDVEYRNRIDVRFSGAMRRNSSLLEMLRAIEVTADVRFAVEGKKVTVTKHAR